MPLSRMAIATLLVVSSSPAPALAQQAGADRAMNRYRQVFQPTKVIDCPSIEDPEVITVCGRRPEVDPNRLPLPVSRVPGERIRGEPGGVGPDCIRLCHRPVQVDLIKGIPAAIEGIKKILDPDR